MDYFEKKKSGDLEKMKLQKSVEKGRKRNRLIYVNSWVDFSISHGNM